LTCLVLGIIFILIYLYSSALVIIDGDSAVKTSLPSESAENQELSVDRTTAEETGSDLKATSRGDEYRAPAAKPAEPVASPAAKPAAAPAAAPKTAPAAAPKADVTAEPKAAVAAAPKAVSDAAPVEPTSGYESDLDLLARLITAEAQGEPYEAQVAVGAVVMNRVKSSDWPNTVKGVIYQEIGGYYQFTPVVNGWIDKPAEPECIKAAKEAMSGADPTRGSQFYYDDKVTNQWILAKTVSVQFGHMIFAF